MVATIAPGPASSGVPSGTSATLEVDLLARVVGLAGEQLQRDQHEQQAAGALQRGQLDVQVVEQRLAGDREDHDHAERQRHRLGAGPVPLRAGSAPVSARKIGTMPGGSTITSRVTKTSPNSLRFTRST